MKVTVDRTKWLRGHGSEVSRLCTIDGKMCCLGFWALAKGFTKEQITNRSTPEELAEEHTLAQVEELVEGGKYRLFVNKSVTEMLMRTNDEIQLSEETREAILIKDGPNAGIEFEFIN